MSATVILSPRLARVAAEIPQGARLVDVGTDHAHLPVSLILEGRIDGAIASDLRRGPLARAAENAGRYGVADKISLRLCPGLEGVRPHEVDTVVIAGMGGETIANILEAAPWTKDCLCVLQPMSSAPELRQWLCRSGYEIRREALVREDKNIYLVMTVTGGEVSHITPGECWGGQRRVWGGDALRGEYLDEQLTRARRALSGLERSTKAEDIPRREEMALVVSQLAELKKEWDS